MSVDHPAPSTLLAGVLLDCMYGCAVVLKWGTKSFHDFLRHRAPPSLAAAGKPRSPLLHAWLGRRERSRGSRGNILGITTIKFGPADSLPQDEVLDWLLDISKCLRRGDRDDGDLAESEAAREIWKHTEIKERSASREELENWLPTVTGSSALL
ncbi:hypothetical protein BS47DRAFT_1339147 [Hydnum rufescens UP504]|uniref:Uncharacterized protein n=1 Tax=Hydnum rufescens UP504 TaxID=1448309 RepID=A0A9P6E0C0_9AGAM|nr:hypothetical protein BS47DRAFT_1339147 [Hydnum rufescens UP504]